MNLSDLRHNAVKWPNYKDTTKTITLKEYLYFTNVFLQIVWNQSFFRIFAKGLLK